MENGHAVALQSSEAPAKSQPVDLSNLFAGIWMDDDMNEDDMPDESSLPGMAMLQILLVLQVCPILEQTGWPHRSVPLFLLVSRAGNGQEHSTDAAGPKKTLLARLEGLPEEPGTSGAAGRNLMPLAVHSTS